jgi:uncharacterized membrane protein
MNEGTLRKIVALGALTGLRSMAGLATLASVRRGIAGPVMALAAASEMIADKTSLVGDRIDPLPLAGRTLLGASVGAFIAAEGEQNVLLGGILGAGTALIAAHLAYHARKRLPVPPVAGGLLEDALVIAVASRYRVAVPGIGRGRR